MARLTPRELEVLARVAAGARTAEVAAQLAITVPTVKRHLTNLYRKLGATNRVEAAVSYLRHQDAADGADGARAAAP